MQKDAKTSIQNYDLTINSEKNAFGPKMSARTCIAYFACLQLPSEHRSPKKSRDLKTRWNFI